MGSEEGRLRGRQRYTAVLEELIERVFTTRNRTPGGRATVRVGSDMTFVVLEIFTVWSQDCEVGKRGISEKRIAYYTICSDGKVGLRGEEGMR